MRRLLSFIFTAVIALCVFTAPALAHTKLTDSIPQTGAIVDAPLAQVTLSFSTDVSESLQKVQVIDPDGDDVAGSANASGSTVTVPVDASGSGTYTVSWRTLGADGHPITGTFAFALREKPTPQPDSSGKTDSSTAQDADHSETKAVPKVKPRPVVLADYPTQLLERIGMECAPSDGHGFFRRSV